MSGYRTQSADTNPDIEEMVLARWRSMLPEEKLLEIDELHRSVDAVARMGIRMRHPEADERELVMRVAALKYGRALVLEAFGWDPDADGD